ncbi:glutamate--cysteine ligase [Klebsiella pneumoniae]|uniref:Glutamate--cysteine ligase n=1 Tax=Klebsiella pneumoniae TaxID=573 RepID=A0A2X3CSS6_KLEPN|nr:glutamate--cysteine ligase [Klebsiella pneumoniae]
MNFMRPIRPKRVTRRGETPSDALLRGGIEYIEVRSLDINPFSPIGVDAQQVRFLDLFMVWCALADAPEMSSDELLCTRTNWNRVILEGRKPGLTLGLAAKARSSRWLRWAKICSAIYAAWRRPWTVSTVARHISRSATSCWPALTIRN